MVFSPMRQTFSGKLAPQLWLLAYAVIGLSIIAFRLPIGTLADPTGWMWFLLACVATVVVTMIAYVVRRPVLTVDDQGLSFAWLIGSWTISWTDVVSVSQRSVRGQVASIGFKLHDGTQGASSVNRALSGYDRLLQNYWGMSLDDLEGLIRRAMAGESAELMPLSPTRRANVGMQSAPAFGRRNAPPTRL